MTVDIIIPAYNPGSYLFDALLSCRNQTYKPNSIIIVDDCSTHDIQPILKKFPDTKYLRTSKNSGPAAARNLGIQNSKSDLISFLDADDIMDPNKLWHSVEAFKNNPSAGMICGNYRIIVNRKKILSPFYKRSITVNHDTLMRQNLVASGSVTVKRTVLDDIGLFDERFWIAEDYDCWLKISEKYPIQYVHKVMYHYSKIVGGSSLTDRQDIQKNHLKNLDIIRKESMNRKNNGNNK